jgi:hypothetical protein
MWAYTITLSFDTVVPDDFVGEALTCYVVADIRLNASAINTLEPRRPLYNQGEERDKLIHTVLSCIHGLPRLAFVHL